jgi:lantibiotic biosynthesis protein
MEPASFFVLRTPLLPFQRLVDLIANADGVASEESVRERLREAVEDPSVREALFLASPSLAESIAIWQEGSRTERGQKVERALIRYFARMAGRPMPFGLFAGCSLGSVGSQTHLQICDPDQYSRRSRLDSGYLWDLGEALSRQPSLRSRLRFFANSSLYVLGDTLRYAEASGEADVRAYQLASVDHSDYLSSILTLAREGATFEQLTQLLVQSFEVSEGEASQFVDDLIESQILVSSLTPTVVGPGPSQVLREELESCGAAGPAALLADAEQRLSRLDGDGVGADPGEYVALAESLKTLPVQPTLARLYQVDLFKRSAGLSLGPEPLAEVTRAISLLRALGARPKRDSLARFRQAFTERYGEGEVPLVEALDEESGIGFERLNDLSADAAPIMTALRVVAPRQAPTSSWTPAHAWLLRRLEGSFSAGVHELSLSDVDLAALAEPNPLPLPTSFAATITLAAARQEDIDQGRFKLLLHHVAGPPGIRLLSRFCYLDGELARHQRETARREQAAMSEVLLAEVVFSVPGRTGNIVHRPHMLEYEIPYLSRSLAPSDHQIPVSDLMVSVTGGRVVLRSRAREREVLPRHTTALTSHWGNLSIYRFLIAVQDQGIASRLQWSWGPLDACTFLPRVVCGRTVLSLARWRLDRSTLDAAGPGEDPAGVVREALGRRGAPRFVSLLEGDNSLPIDLRNPLALQALVHAMRQSGELVLTECFPTPEELCVRDSTAAYAHELIIPFHDAGDPAGRATSGVPIQATTLQRNAPPGSQWLYFKLYGGESTLDRALCETMAPLLEQVRDRIEGWFFVRYYDPDFHLRLRLKVLDRAAHDGVRSLFEGEARGLLARGKIWRFQLDTYQRELERYGGLPFMELSETIFHADSEAVLAAITQLGIDRLRERWYRTLAGMDRLLDDLGFDVQAKLALVTRARDRYRGEFQVTQAVIRQIGDRFRAEGPIVRTVLEAEHARTQGDGPLPPFSQRSRRLQPAVDKLRAACSDGQSPLSLEDYAQNFLHMHANRMLRSALRAQELILYDFLTRLYDAERARQAGTRDRSPDRARS